MFRNSDHALLWAALTSTALPSLPESRRQKSWTGWTPDGPDALEAFRSGVLQRILPSARAIRSDVTLAGLQDVVLEMASTVRHETSASVAALAERKPADVREAQEAWRNNDGSTVEKQRLARVYRRARKTWGTTRAATRNRKRAHAGRVRSLQVDGSASEDREAWARHFTHESEKRYASPEENEETTK